MNVNNVIYFDRFEVEYIPKETKKIHRKQIQILIEHKHIIR